MVFLAFVMEELKMIAQGVAMHCNSGLNLKIYPKKGFFKAPPFETHVRVQILLAWPAKLVSLRPNSYWAICVTGPPRQAQACKFSGPRHLKMVELWNSSFFWIDFKLKPELELIDNGLVFSLYKFGFKLKYRCKERRNQRWDKAPHPSYAHVKVHIRLLPWPTKLASSCVWRQLN